MSILLFTTVFSPLVAVGAYMYKERGGSPLLFNVTLIGTIVVYFWVGFQMIALLKGITLEASLQ